MAAGITGYAHDDPFDSGFLRVDSIHEIFYEQYGAVDGLPVVYLHGGPGGSTSRANTKYFNPAVYRVVLFDQRGAGKSRPQNELKENTTQRLTEDIEKLREHVGVSKWHMVFGGSWGSTLGLHYTQSHPDRVASIVVRGVFTMRKSELGFSPSNPGPATKFFPEEYERFINFLPEPERQDPTPAYYKRMTSEDRETALAAAREWNRWELSLGTLVPGPNVYAKLDDPDWCLTHALFEAHFGINGAWLEDGQLLAPENIEKMKHIPGAIVQGRYDLVAPPQTAWELHKAWPISSLYFIDNAGHSASEPGIASKLVQVCDEFATAKL
ncbi:prolyl aminopeptidase [Xylariales sp. PMI_506]|nr:prolyl aminopeptidase [Xylariales sp. PMI_506]